jgi:hypothetical protein
LGKSIDIEGIGLAPQESHIVAPADGGILPSYGADADDYRRYGSLAKYYRESDFDSPVTSVSIALKNAFPITAFALFCLETVLGIADVATHLLTDAPYLKILANPIAQTVVTVLSFLVGLMEFTRSRSQRIQVIRTTRRSWSPIKFIWPGSGQIRFSCGPRGVMISNMEGFDHFINWGKISHIYLERDPSYFSMSKIDESYLSDEDKVELEEKGRACIPAEHERSNGLHADNIRIRLINTQEQTHGPKNRENYTEELIIPNRFFDKQFGLHSQETFLQNCWRLKAWSQMYSRF